MSEQPAHSASKLGAWRGATITCDDADAAARRYGRALGFDVVESGFVTEALAASWGAPRVSGARYVLVGPESGDFFVRFVAQAGTPAHTPYLSTGWTALEFTVESSDAAIERLRGEGFRVLGEAEDLDFAAGALRAGQVVGPFGEVLYLTQINRQIDDFTLPHARCGVDRMFICILVTRDMQACADHYASAFGCARKPSFEAAVPFIADYLGKPADTIFTVGTVELQPESYIELDGLPGNIAVRTAPDGLLPAGIAMVTVGGDPAGPLAQSAIAAPVAADGALYAGGEAIALRGYHGELIEIVGPPTG